MTIKEAISIFDNLISKSDKKAQIRTFRNFVNILYDLEKKNLSDIQLLDVERQLELLDLKDNSHKNNRYFKRKLIEFRTYLEDEFSLISKGYYTGLGMSLGMCFGVALGASVFGQASGVSTGLVIGMIIGMAIGKHLDAKAEKEDRVLNSRIK